MLSIFHGLSINTPKLFSRCSNKTNMMKIRKVSSNSFAMSLETRLHNTKSIDKAENLELDTLKVMKPLCLSMKDIILEQHHPLHNVSEVMKNTINEIDIENSTGREVSYNYIELYKYLYIYV